MDIEFHAPGYRVIETIEIQHGAKGPACAVVDRQEKIVWLYKGTPASQRQSIISEALQLAAEDGVSRVPLIQRQLD